MKKLKLPIIKKEMAPAKCLSMDDYLKFVNLNLKNIRKISRQQHKLSAVNVPFVL